MKTNDFAAYVFLAIGWGLSFLLILKVIQAFGWVGSVTFRAFVAAAAIVIAATLTRRRLHFRVRWWHFAVVGATTVAGQLVGLSLATPRIGTAMTAILVATIPLFSMVIGQAWGVERMTLRGLAGLIVGFAGVVLLVGFPAVPITGTFVFGCACALVASFFAAFGSNYANLRLNGVGSWESTLGSFLSGGLITLPLLLVAPVPSEPQAIDFLYLLILGVVLSAVNYVLYFRLITTIGATKAISVEFAVTLVAVMVGALFLAEALSAMQFAGAATVLLGCALVLDLVPQGEKPAPPA